MSDLTFRQARQLSKTQVFLIDGKSMSISPKDKYKDPSYMKPKGIRVPVFIWYLFYSVVMWQQDRRTK